MYASACFESLVINISLMSLVFAVKNFSNLQNYDNQGAVNRFPVESHLVFENGIQLFSGKS